MISHGAFLPLAEPGIRAKAMLAGKKLFIFTAVDENFNKDAALKITAFEQGKMNSWNLRWGYGMFPAYMMKKDHSFVIELPLPSHWKSIDDLNIEVKTFLRK